MASHLNCHEAQPQPSMYPPALPLTREHGAISEYNYWGHAMVGPFHHSPQGMFGEYKMLDNLQSEDGLADYVSNDFGGLQLNNQISIQGNEDDLFPTPKPPTPTVKWTLPTKLQPDPDLMITPEKRPPNLKQPNKNIDKEKLKVHFDENVQTRICSPDETNDESISNESNDNKQSLPYNYRVFRHSAEYNGIAAQGGGSMFSNSGIGVTHGGDHTRNFETQTEKILERVHQPPTSNQGTQKIVQSSIQESKPSSVKAGSEPTKQDDKKIKSVQKGFKPLLRHTKFTSKKPVHKTETVAESEFARPEFHSTLRVGAELKELQQRGVDAKAVVKQKLKVSESLNAKVVEKAVSKVNQTPVRSTLTQLASLDVPLEELVHQVAQDEQAKVKPVVREIKTKKPSKEPDLMEFFSPEFEKESANFVLKDMPSMLPRPQTAPDWNAFDLYRHIRMWEGLH